MGKCELDSSDSG